MKKFFGITLITFAAAVCTFGADASADIKALKGTWLPTKAELGSQPMSDEVLKTIVLQLDKDKYEVTVAGNPDKGTWTADSSTKPKSMTVTGVEGPNAGKVFPCI